MTDRFRRNAHLYLPTLQTPGQLRHFLHDVRGHPIPSPALFGQMTREWVARIEHLAAEQGVPLIRFERGERKEERVRSFFERAEERLLETIGQYLTAA